MELILLQKVANLGNIGDRVKVKSGYGRNFLLPKGKATLATAENVARFDARRAELERVAHEELHRAQQRAAAIKDFKLSIIAKAGSEGKLFGSVGTADIAEAATAAGHSLARSEVRLPGGPLRAVGEHRCSCTCTPTSKSSCRSSSSPKKRAEAGGRGRVSTPLRSRRDGGSAGAEGLVPPHSLEAEQSVLGALLIDKTAWDQVADIVTTEDFYRPDHRLIFEALGELVAAGRPADVVTVSEQLERRGRLTDAGGLAYLGTLAGDTPTAANARSYAQIVRERSLLRRLIEAGREIASSVFSDDGLSARDLVDRAEGLVFEIAEQGLRTGSGACASARCCRR
jgi:ribosomal protein L9